MTLFAASLLAVLAAAPASRAERGPIIDVHMHAYPAAFLTPEQKRDIFYDNAVRFFRLEGAKPR